MKELKPSKESPLDSNRLVQMLCNVFPAFNDVTTYQGRTVCILKKAQLLVADLSRHVGAMDEAWKCDTSKLTVFADNVIPCVLREVGILEITDNDLREKIDNSKVIAAGIDDCELRLASVAACERILSKCKGITAMQLDLYL